jgi:hypothetical protein
MHKLHSPFAFALCFAFVSLLIGCFTLLPRVQALSPEPDGGYPRGNTAEGEKALLNLTTGSFNTAVGYFSLRTTATSIFNTANGAYALRENTSGGKNTATGVSALNSNTTGSDNTASGAGALQNNTTFKPMEQTSEALLALKPVTFRYKKEIDPAGISQFGLVAKEVEKVNPDLVVRDKEGKPYSVRYDHVNAMLLNEFLKAHQKLEEQGATIAKQQKQIEALTAGLQKVSEQMELSKPVRQMVMNKQ